MSGGHVHHYSVQRGHPVEVIDDRGNHLDMSSEEIEEYWEFLR